MAERDTPHLSPPSAEEQAAAAKKFEYATRASAGGNYDIAIQMLRECCQLMPAHLPYRQALRKAQKTKYKDNKHGSSLAAITTVLPKARLGSALKAKQYREALDIGEEILSKNPWDKATIIQMAEAAAKLDLPVVAVWLLQEARESSPNNPDLARALARLLEEQKHFSQAMVLWEIVRRANPTDREAEDKIKQMAVDDTMARGHQLNSSTAELVALPATPGTPPPPTRLTPAQKRVVDEIDSLKQRIEKDPTRPDLYLQLANAHRKQNHLSEALAVLRKGLQATHQAPELSFALADLEIEPYRRKLAEIDEYLKTKPTDEEQLKLRLKVVRKIDKLELECCEKKAMHDPSDKAARFELGLRRFRLGMVQEAIPELQAARGDMKLQWQTLLYLGRCFKALGNWPLVQRNFDEALRHLPASEEAQKKELLFELASGHAAAGELERAVELGLDLADLDYAYRDIGKLLSQWQKQLASRPVKQ